MRKKHRHLRQSWAVLLVLLLVLLSGCGGQQPEAPASGSEAPSGSAPSGTEAPTPGTEAPSGDPQPAGDGMIRVSSTEELLEAIAPSASIVIEAGSYNMSDTLEDLWEQGGEAWNEQHEYVQLKEVFDGVQLCVQNVKGLTIAGDSEDRAKTSLVIDPRYASVMYFEDCSDISLSSVTMGHTDMGDCSGNVIDLFSCHNVAFDNVDFYGCGVIGIMAWGGCSDIVVTDSVIRDCADGPFSYSECSGRLWFTDCNLEGSGWGGYYDCGEDADLAFTRCFFGGQESNCWFFRDYDAIFTDCEWSEITEYPDYGYEDEAYEVNFDLGHAEVQAIDKTFLDSTSWYGYMTVDPESGETTDLPYEEEDGTEFWCGMSLDEDGSGWLILGEDAQEFTWEVIDGYTACFTTDGVNHYATFYAMPSASGDEDDMWIWMLLQLDEMEIWMY